MTGENGSDNVKIPKTAVSKSCLPTGLFHFALLEYFRNCYYLSNYVEDILSLSASSPPLAAISVTEPSPRDLERSTANMVYHPYSAEA